jgi:hypothetical protein
MRATKPDGYKEAGHDLPFKPTKDISRKVKADFDHKTELAEFKKTYRDHEGAVITEPRNFLTWKRSIFGWKYSIY